MHMCAQRQYTVKTRQGLKLHSRVAETPSVDSQHEDLER